MKSFTRIGASIALGLAAISLSAQSPGAWTVLFDGKDLSAFTQTGAAQWTIEDGLVGGRSRPGQRGSSLVQEYSGPGDAAKLRLKPTRPSVRLRFAA